MQVLVLQEVAKAAHGAYLAGTLTAQAEDPANCKALYALDCDEFGGRICRRCAIGASFDNETFMELQKPYQGCISNEYANISSLIDRGVVKVANAREVSGLANLQLAHDLWARGRRENEVPEKVEGLKQGFLALVTRFAV